MITLHYTVRPATGQPVSLNCPACNAKGVMSIPREGVDSVKIAYLIPIFSLRNTSIRCSRCSEDITCLIPMDQIASQNAASIEEHLRYHPSSTAKLLSVAGFFTSLIPVLGLLIVSIAMFCSRGTKGWASRLNLYALIFAVTSTLLLALVYFVPM